MKAIHTVLIAFVLVFAVFVSGAKDDATGSQVEQKNMTFVQCVSEKAELKNSCYAATKETLKSCKVNAANETNSKVLIKACNADYKKASNNCKSDFKTAKNECKKIKHSMMDSMRVMFK